jgi:hypothetical protein
MPHPVLSRNDKPLDDRHHQGALSSLAFLSFGQPMRRSDRSHAQITSASHVIHNTKLLDAHKCIKLPSAAHPPERVFSHQSGLVDRSRRRKPVPAFGAGISNFSRFLSLCSQAIPNSGTLSLGNTGLRARSAPWELYGFTVPLCPSNDLANAKSFYGFTLCFCGFFLSRLVAREFYSPPHQPLDGRNSRLFSAIPAGFAWSSPVSDGRP